MPRALLHELQVEEGMQEAARWLRTQAEAITRLQIAFAQLPSPDLRALPRAQLFAQTLHDMALHDVYTDAVGNVLGTLPGSDPTLPPVVLSAHLDSVFPHLDHIEVQRDGTVLRGPGIADDAAGLAAVVFLLRALQRTGMQLQRSVVAAATVGEEGEGDLQGVKHLFRNAWHDTPPAAFLTLDLGSPRHAANAALGSRRFEVQVTGPGGHSWGDFGRPNPIHALARGVALFLAARTVQEARGSWNVGRIEGGHGINVIPEQATLRVDLRSGEPLVLEELVASFHAAIAEGVRQEQVAARSLQDELLHEVHMLGDRPTGETRQDSFLVQTLAAAFEACGLPLVLTRSSTDANVPMSLGIAAVALPHGARAYNAHSEKEWCDVQGRESILAAELLALLALTVVP